MAEVEVRVYVVVLEGCLWVRVNEDSIAIDSTVLQVHCVG